MKLETNVPIYCQVLDDIRKKAVNGQLKPGQKLPSVRALAELYQINPNTAARIYRELETEGLAITRKGLGTYMCSDQQVLADLKSGMVSDCISRFVTEMKNFGFDKHEIPDLVKRSL